MSAICHPTGIPRSREHATRHLNWDAFGRAHRTSVRNDLDSAFFRIGYKEALTQLSHADDFPESMRRDALWRDYSLSLERPAGRGGDQAACHAGHDRQ